MFQQFTMRTLFGFVFLVVCAVSFLVAFTVPVRQEAVVLTKLRDSEAEFTAEPFVPKQTPGFARVRAVDSSKLQEPVSIDLPTPQATIEFLGSDLPSSRLERLTLTGAAVNLDCVTRVLAGLQVQTICLDSTAISEKEIMGLRRAHPECSFATNDQWIHRQIDQFGGFPFYEIKNPLIVIRTVNQLRSVGKEIAVATLDRYLLNRDERDQQKIRKLIPMLFLRMDSTEELPLNRRTHVPRAARWSGVSTASELLDLLEAAEEDNTEPLDTTGLDSLDERKAYILDAPHWPGWRDVYFEGNIAFYVTGLRLGGYSLPRPETPAYLVRWAEDRGVLIDKLAVPIHDPRRLRSRLLARFCRSHPDRDLQRASREIDDAISLLLDGVSGPSKWNSQLQKYESATRSTSR